MDIIDRYHARRDNRIAIQKFHERRDERMRMREDASGRLAFGLCKKYGIETKKGWTPYDAWKALEEKTGKSQKDFYKGSGQEGNDKIKTSVDKNDFIKKLFYARNSNSDDSKWRVSKLVMEDFQKEHPNAKLHITDGGSTIGISNGDIFGVCKNTADKEMSGSTLLQFAVNNGGNKLDSFEGNHDFYIRNGFEPISWCEFDERFKPDGWRKGTDKPERIIFYKYVGKDKVTEKYKDANNFFNEVKKSEDYDTAKEKRNAEID